MDEDLVAQFCAITNAEVDSAQQYLAAADFSLEAAIELFFASGGVSADGQSSALPGAAGSASSASAEPEVRERIESHTDRLVDPHMEMMADLLPRRPARRLGIFNQGRDTDIGANMSPHERRLAELFRPPFDIIRDLDLDSAKEDAQEEKKWIMVNIQDPTEFSCQQLNRDLWRNEQVKDILRENFIFLQYDNRSMDGESYRLLYPFDQYPHIAILDAWTGEQQRIWTRVPSYDQFVEQLLEFLGTPADYSEAAASRALPPEVKTQASSARGPVSESTRTPASKVGAGLTSFSTSAGTSENAATNERSPELGTQLGPETRAQPGSGPQPAVEDDAEDDPIEGIEAQDIAEPAPGSTVTRIQIRLGDGKRIVRRFDLSATVRDIYAYIKFAVPALQNESLILRSDRRNLSSELDKTIDEANLKNSTILVDIR